MATEYLVYIKQGGIMANISITTAFAAEMHKKANKNAPVDPNDVEGFIKSLARSYECDYVGIEDDCYVIEGSRDNINRIHTYILTS